MAENDQTWTDPDGFVTLRRIGDEVTISVSTSGFARPSHELARLVRELGTELPEPDAETNQAMNDGIAALGAIQQAASTGGYDAVAAMMRQRLGVETPGPVPVLDSDPAIDGGLGVWLGGFGNAMTEAAAARQDPEREPLFAESRTSEGDVGVTTSSREIIAGVHIGPNARYLGVEGLGRALTEQLAAARAELAKAALEQARKNRPEEVSGVLDGAEAGTQREADRTNQMIDEYQQAVASAKRKMGLQ
ncbi:hypothetical protein [Glycomyces buryatensis]|uniref:Uncharacterized protein n=1 Tax=Glycomyces buryatensis TaxID=2570927 RepID=A0A4V4HSI9_9ACTN|nr:hypothetical protein [Glycomyces buryatensis]THV41876.1 hypothetical protein FAB82_09145 [Glycomyces buryatensis]